MNITVNQILSNIFYRVNTGFQSYHPLFFHLIPSLFGRRDGRGQLEFGSENVVWIENPTTAFWF